jgi:hypothetical protein
MSTAVASRDYHGLFLPPRNTGTSESAARLARIMVSAAKDLAEPVTWQLRMTRAHEALLETYEQCSEKNWDGHEAKPLSVLALVEATTFLEALPSWIPLPEIIPEPDGTIGMEWFGGRDRIFVVNLSGRNVVAYAGLAGKGDRAHGTKVFNDSIPPAVIEGVTEALG